MEVTAYTHTGDRTASGKWPKPGMCAIDPKFFKFGTRFYVEGYGFATAEDTGRLIKGVRPGQRTAKGELLANMDLFMESEREAEAWGRPVVKVYVYD